MNRKKAIYLLAVFCVLFLTLIGYMTYTEFNHAKEYSESVYNPRITEEENKKLRGTIYDRNGNILAYSEEVEEEITEVVNGVTTTKTHEKIDRVYPYANLYCNVIGVNKVQPSKYTIETAYRDELLKDKFGSDTGSDITLTIDHDLQQTAYDALGSYNGVVVAMNPKTGEILAMVSKPDFDPNKIEEINFSELPDGALYSKALQWKYPPGSTYKIITTAGAIKYGYDDKTYNDTKGTFTVKSDDGNSKNDYTCRNAGGAIYYRTDLEHAFIKSSNVYYAYMGTVLGSDNVHDIAGDFLLGENAEKKIAFDLPVIDSTMQNGTLTDAECAMASIGQGQTEMTPLHLALVASTIANDGIMPRPYIVSAIDNENMIPAENPGTEIIDYSTAQQIKDYMLSVVRSGTGTAAQISGINVCGKTGTSENSETAKSAANSGKTHALFVGFAPYEDPEIAVCVIAEYAGGGGSKAGPIAQKVMKKYLIG